MAEMGRINRPIASRLAVSAASNVCFRESITRTEDHILPRTASPEVALRRGPHSNISFDRIVSRCFSGAVGVGAAVGTSGV